MHSSYILVAGGLSVFPSPIATPGVESSSEGSPDPVMITHVPLGIKQHQAHQISSPMSNFPVEYVYSTTIPRQGCNLEDYCGTTGGEKDSGYGQGQMKYLPSQECLDREYNLGQLYICVIS